MSKYRFENVWPDPSEEVRSEVVEFWRQHTQLSEGKARERSRQLLAICRTLDEEIAAVSTAIPTFVQHLGLRCYFFRTLIAPGHRTRGLRATRLLQEIIHFSYGVLNDRFQTGIATECLGLYMEVENPNIIRRRNQLVWTDGGANIVYLGQTARGHQARVWYFEDACLPAH